MIRELASVGVATSFDRSSQFSGPLGLHIFRNDVTPVSTLDLDRNFNILARAVSSRLLTNTIAGPLTVNGATTLNGTVNVLGSATMGQLIVSAGASSSDVAFAVRNAAGVTTGLSVAGDGSGAIGSPPNQIRWNAAGVVTLTGSASLPFPPLVNTLAGLNDVTVAMPALGQALMWNGTRWVNQAIPTGTALAGLSDVRLNNPQGGQLITFDNLANAWINSPYPNLGRLLDVTILAPQANQILRYNGALGMWTNEDPGGLTLPLNVGNMLVLNVDHTGYLGPNATSNLSWDANGNFTFKGNAAFAGGVSGVTLAGLSDVTLSAQTTGQVLTWNAAASRWVNQPIPPTGVTSISAQTGVSGLVLTPNPIIASGTIALDWSQVPALGGTNNWTGVQTFTGNAIFNGTLTANGAASFLGFRTVAGGGGSIGVAPNTLSWNAAGAFTLNGTASLPIPSLAQLPDVGPMSPVQTDVLQWNGSRWINVSVSTVGRTTLQSLTDVGAMTPVAGQLLSYNGTRWINVASSSVGLDIRPLDNTFTGNNTFSGGGFLTFAGVGQIIVQVPITTYRQIVMTQPSQGLHFLGADSVSAWNLLQDTTTQSMMRLGGPAAGGSFVLGTPTQNVNLTVNGTISPGIQALADVGAMTPATGQLLGWNGTRWINTTVPPGGATISDTAPASPFNGQIWFRSTDGTLSVWYPSQWVGVSGGGGVSLAMPNTWTATQTFNGVRVNNVASDNVATGTAVNQNGIPLQLMNGTVPAWQLGGMEPGDAFVSAMRWNNAMGGADIQVGHDRSATTASSAVLAVGDELGSFSFAGSVGTATPIKAARIQAFVDTTWSATSTPTRLEFLTCGVGTTTASTRMRIRNTLPYLSLGGYNPAANSNPFFLIYDSNPYMAIRDYASGQEAVFGYYFAGSFTSTNFEIRANNTPMIVVTGPSTVNFPHLPQATSGYAVYFDQYNNLYSAASASRYKTDIRRIGAEWAQEILHKLKPVFYRSTLEHEDKEQVHIGLIAEEVAEVCPELVLYKDGQPESVQYDKLAVLLLAAA